MGRLNHLHQGVVPFNGFAAKGLKRIHLALTQQGNSHARAGNGADALGAGQGALR